MYIETRYYDNGRAEAKLHYSRPEKEPDDLTTYVDEVDDLQEWIEDNLEINLDDVVQLVLDLDAGNWVDITQYI
jgi:hypothetical protein